MRYPSSQLFEHLHKRPDAAGKRNFIALSKKEQDDDDHNASTQNHYGKTIA